MNIHSSKENPHQELAEEPSNLERIAKGQRNKKNLSKTSNIPQQFEDEEDQQYDSQGLQVAQHDGNVIKTLFPQFSLISWTCLFVILQIFGFIAVSIYSSYFLDVSTKQLCPSYYSTQQIINENCLTKGQCALYSLGGRYTPALTERYQYYRLLTSLFIQSDIIQLIMNVFSSMLYGFVAENYYGAKKYLFVIFASGICGNLFSAFFKTEKVYAGASACLYGLYGMSTVYIIEHFTYLGEDRKKHLKNFMWIIFTTFAIFSLDLEADFVNLPFSYLIGLGITFLYLQFDQQKYKILQKAVLLVMAHGIGFLVYYVVKLDAQYREDILPCFLF